MEITLGQASLEDLVRLKVIWRESFDDPADYMDFYFSRRFVPEETFVLREDGVPAAMMTAMPVTLLDRDETVKGKYIYAVATHPSARGKGYSTRLHRYMLEVLRQEGFGFTCLVPAEESLQAFYARQGYRPYFSRWVREFGLEKREEGGEEELPSLPFRDFYRRRYSWFARLAAGHPALWHPQPALGYIYDEMISCGGQIVELPNGGYAVFQQMADTLILRETDQPPLTTARYLMGQLNLSRARIEAPYPFPGSVREEYGMLCPLKDGLPDSPGYMALMLD